MARHGDLDIKELLDYIDPETFLDYEGITYKRTFGSSGSQLNLKECPRCGGTGWKVYLNAETGLGNCFHGSCVGEPGYNLFSFSRHLWQTDSAETIEKLKVYAKEQGWIAKRRTSKSVEYVTDEVELPDSVELPYKGTIPKYLTERGITPDIAKLFHLRYCHKGQYIYYDHEGKRRWQNYDKRIIIPVFDLNGDIVTFQGRDIVGISDRKYLFPNGLPGTARFLYNAFNVTGYEEIVICEGAFDVMATKIAFDEDVALRRIGQVGSFGKNLSHGSENGDDQLGTLAKMRSLGLKRVVLMWDGEASALKDAAKAAKLILSLGLDAKVAILPKDKDPNEVEPSVVRKAYYQATSPTSSKLMKAILDRRS
ncbi:toprim domain-containing protein [Vibrio parahaemolyticus]|uniref:toprim domain-containing protein n=2 Tax=Vibrio parahaemolyticus TaxID=670 RepID=UPI00111CD922|nr:toprim domain-containing protein [Vibrio parahaemolyticus]TOJ14071.1 DNA primase [Vibrio parahaemolyticus]